MNTIVNLVAIVELALILIFLIIAKYNSKSHVKMRRVILESPFAGNIERNTDYARACLRDCLERGEAPIASHLLYTQPGVLDDNVPEQRQWGIDAGLEWGLMAEATVVYTDLGISCGMEYGIAAAKKAGRPIEYRSLPNWDG